MGYSLDRMSIVLPIAIGIIILVELLNTVGSSMGGTIQTIATVCKLVPSVFIIIVGFIKGNGNPIIQPLVGSGVSVGGALGAVLIATLFAYDGWINVGSRKRFAKGYCTWIICYNKSITYININSNRMYNNYFNWYTCIFSNK